MNTQITHDQGLDFHIQLGILSIQGLVLGGPGIFLFKVDCYKFSKVVDSISIMARVISFLFNVILHVCFVESSMQLEHC